MNLTRSAKSCSLVAAISCLMAWCAPGHALADPVNNFLSVSPSGWDFGEVVVGDSQVVTFTLSSLGPSQVWVYEICLTDATDVSVGTTTLVSPYRIGDPYFDPGMSNWVVGYALGAFSFDPTDALWPVYPAPTPLPTEMAAGSSLTLDLIFRPPSPGDFSAYLYIHSNDEDLYPGPQALLPLHGRGVAEAVPEPSSLLLLVTGLVLAGRHARRGGR